MYRATTLIRRTDIAVVMHFSGDLKMAATPNVCKSYMCSSVARIGHLCIFHHNLGIGRDHNPRVKCVRCGASRHKSKGKPVPLCRDCKGVLSPEERELWAA